LKKHLLFDVLFSDFADFYNMRIINSLQNVFLRRITIKSPRSTRLVCRSGKSTSVTSLIVNGLATKSATDQQQARYVNDKAGLDWLDGLMTIGVLSWTGLRVFGAAVFVSAVFVGGQSGRGVPFSWHGAKKQLMKRGDRRETNNLSTEGSTNPEKQNVDMLAPDAFTPLCGYAGLTRL
jgi:hypothetical protein